jgi:hypothetical protein
VPVKKTNIHHSYRWAQISATHILILATGTNILHTCSYKGNHHFTEGWRLGQNGHTHIQSLFKKFPKWGRRAVAQCSH